MMMRKLLPAGLLLASCTLPACQGGCDEPAPECFSGTVVGSTCVDGLLIDVDPQHPIGQPGILPRHARPDTLLGRNVIAVVNTREFAMGRPVVGQRLYFTYVNDPNRQWNGLCCFANDGVKTDIPRLVLSNVSTAPCNQPSRNK